MSGMSRTPRSVKRVINAPVKAEPIEEENLAKQARKSAPRSNTNRPPKSADGKVMRVSDAKYWDSPTNFEPDEVTRLSQEHLEKLKFKHFKYDPKDSLDDIMKKNPLLDVILGTKKFTADYETTTIDSEVPPDDKDERELSRVAGPRLKNAALFDYYCKSKTLEKITELVNAPHTPQPSTSMGWKTENSSPTALLRAPPTLQPSDSTGTVDLIKEE